MVSCGTDNNESCTCMLCTCIWGEPHWCVAMVVVYCWKTCHCCRHLLFHYSYVTMTRFYLYIFSIFTGNITWYFAVYNIVCWYIIRTKGAYINLWHSVCVLHFATFAQPPMNFILRRRVRVNVNVDTTRNVVVLRWFHMSERSFGVGMGCGTDSQISITD